jgi:hypothetical protein
VNAINASKDADSVFFIKVMFGFWLFACDLPRFTMA